MTSLRLVLTFALPLTLGLAACSSDDGSATTDTASSSSSGASHSSTSASSASSSGSTGDTSSGSSGPDPDYVRACQPGDFTCDEWGCENPPNVAPGQCYKRCTPTEIGGPDDECDEPERPYCSQVGRSLGGDFDCNGCAHVCVAAPINQCQQGVDACGP
ncbi:MAG: hypothetical protein KC420_18105 [Myxococcales bacterium]|nr:hypothetical protein [Myxococcales bacterium]MCB9567560.1 hypothetical protein [Myxococcales bacterium]MCB9700566.1 hypothetical protein [Myxococcales bacterium]